MTTHPSEPPTPGEHRAPLSVGAQLRQAREARELSYGDVTRNTKIQPWVLEALEADRLPQMMSPIYAKGFLGTYARFLRLEPGRLMAAVSWPRPEPEQADLPPPQIPIEFTLPQMALPQIPLPILRRLGIGVAASTTLAVLVLLNPAQHLRSWKPSKLAAPKAAASKTNAKAARAPAAQAVKVTTAIPATAVPPPKLASVAPVAEPIRPAAQPTLTLLPTQPLELEVHATTTTWVQVRADGKLLTQQRLARGARERWAARRRFELVIAKPTQVELTLNGQSIGSFAIAHQGRLLITHQGITKLAE